MFLTNIKQSVLYLVLLSILLFSCGSSSDSSDQKPLNSTESGESTVVSDLVYVAALTGINLREEPGIGGKSIQLIPYMTELKVLEHDIKKESIDGFEGHWIKVSVNENVEGFLFDGFLLPIMPPPTNPPTGIEGYFKENLIRIGNQEAVRLIYDERIEGFKTIKVSLDKVKVEEESDMFEIKQEYAGGYYLTEQIGYENQTIKGFFPGLSLRQGFLLARSLMPSFGYDNCELPLRSLKFPTKDETIRINDGCSYQVTLEVKDGKINKISFLSSDLGYYGLDIKNLNNGVEISTLYAL